MPAARPAASGYVAWPPVAVNGACGVPSTTVLKICAAPEIASSALSAVPENFAANPVPDQAKRGCAGFEVVSTRPNQRTPAATTPAGGWTGLLPSTGGPASLVMPP